jgi:hypothetical protein
MIPRRVLYFLCAVAACAVFLFSGNLPAMAQEGSGDQQTFDNGHSISGEIYTFYYSVKNPELIFGLPITVVFDDPLNKNRQIQYFERARMEFDPAMPAGQQVSLANLGEFAYDTSHPGIQAPIQPNDPMCRDFPKGKTVCYAFLNFYDQYGEKYFGLPITNAMFTEEGRLVQYFQRVRMEWRGEMPKDQRVVITALGQVDFDIHIGDQSKRWPEQTGTIQRIIPNLRAFAGRPLLANGEKQQIFALVQDQFGRPIQGASVTVTFFYPEDNANGSGISGINSDLSGIAIADYTVNGVEPNGVVRVNVVAVVNGARLTTSTWFRVWW